MNLSSIVNTVNTIPQIIANAPRWAKIAGGMVALGGLGVTALVANKVLRRATNQQQPVQAPRIGQAIRIAPPHISNEDTTQTPASTSTPQRTGASAALTGHTNALTLPSSESVDDNDSTTTTNGQEKPEQSKPQSSVATTTTWSLVNPNSTNNKASSRSTLQLSRHRESGNGSRDKSPNDRVVGSERFTGEADGKESESGSVDSSSGIPIPGQNVMVGDVESSSESPVSSQDEEADWALWGLIGNLVGSVDPFSGLMEGVNLFESS